MKTPAIALFACLLGLPLIALADSKDDEIAALRATVRALESQVLAQQKEIAALKTKTPAVGLIEKPKAATIGLTLRYSSVADVSSFEQKMRRVGDTDVPRVNEIYDAITKRIEAGDTIWLRSQWYQREKQLRELVGQVPVPSATQPANNNVTPIVPSFKLGQKGYIGTVKVDAGYGPGSVLCTIKGVKVVIDNMPDAPHQAGDTIQINSLCEVFRFEITLDPARPVLRPVATEFPNSIMR